MTCVDQDYGILIFFIKTALKMQEIEFQSLRNPWTSLEVSHIFGTTHGICWIDPAWTGNVKLFLQSTSITVPFICFYHLGKEMTANLSGKKIREKLNKLVLFQHQ